MKEAHKTTRVNKLLMFCDSVFLAYYIDKLPFQEFNNLGKEFNLFKDECCSVSSFSLVLHSFRVFMSSPPPSFFLCITLFIITFLPSFLLSIISSFLNSFLLILSSQVISLLPFFLSFFHVFFFFLFVHSI